MRADGLRPTLAFKQLARLILYLFLVLADLHRVDAVILRNLVDGLDPTHRFKANFGLEFRRVYLPLL